MIHESTLLLINPTINQPYYESTLPTSGGFKDRRLKCVLADQKIGLK
ncbi:hypothetical protein amyaer_3008 [Microcystis aeruginosa NIES-2481]|nr:hypothetical protein amyaer_3008 [Microcystis aeruginosa NIES-2481]